MEYVPRVDQYGRDLRTPPERRAMLFTGPAGSGTSMEMDRLERSARMNGHLVIRVKAINERYLGDQLAEAVRGQLGDIARSLPRDPKARTRRGMSRFMGWRRQSTPADDPRLESLRQTLDAMGGLRQSVRRGNNYEVQIGGQLLGGFGARTIDQSDQQSQLPRARPSELADRLAEVAALSGRQAVMLIDDIHALDEKKGLAALNDLARHVNSRNGNIHLAAGGRSEAFDELVTASSPNQHVAHDPTRLFDHRAIQPPTPAQMRDALIRSMQSETQWHDRLRQHRRQYTGVTEPPVTFGISSDAADLLVETAGGNIQLLEEYRRAAMSFSTRQRNASGEALQIEPEAAAAGIRHVHQRRHAYYQGVWKHAGDAERELFRMVGRGRADGLARDEVDPAISDPERDADATERLENLNRARERGLQAGWLTESKEGRIRFADAGHGDWICTEQLRTEPMTPQLAEIARQRAVTRGRPERPQVTQRPPEEVRQAAALASTGQSVQYQPPVSGPYAPGRPAAPIPSMPTHRPAVASPTQQPPPVPTHQPPPPMPTQPPTPGPAQVAGQEAAARASTGIGSKRRYTGRHRRPSTPISTRIRDRIDRIPFGRGTGRQRSGGGRGDSE